MALLKIFWLRRLVLWYFDQNEVPCANDKFDGGVKLLTNDLEPSERTALQKIWNVALPSHMVSFRKIKHNFVDFALGGIVQLQSFGPGCTAFGKIARIVAKTATCQTSDLTLLIVPLKYSNGLDALLSDVYPVLQETLHNHTAELASDVRRTLDHICSDGLYHVDKCLP
jgi:hypothetical protein